jgi:hypothetical protein
LVLFLVNCLVLKLRWVWWCWGCWDLRTWFLSGRDYTGCCSVVEAVFGPALQRRGAMHNLLFHLPFIKPLFAQLAVQDLQKQVPQRLLGTFSTIKQPPPKACANVCAFACV